MKYAEFSTKFRKFFELPSSPVAVRIITDNSQEQKTSAQPMRFCEMVRRSAFYGESFIFGVEELTCTSAELALGFTEPSYGEVYPRIKPANTKLVSVSPLEKTEKKPDVVIIVGTPRKIMRVSTILSQLHEKQPVEAKFKGEFAVCGECTAIPFMEKKVNLSLLCNGARMFSGYRDDEIVMGFPLDDFIRIAESTEEKEITSALCGCIMDDIPAGAVAAIEKIGFGKGTDQFFGRFGGEIVRLYTPKDKDGKITSLTLHIPVKFRDSATAAGANQIAEKLLEKPMLHRVRDNWVDIALPLELGEALNRASMRGEKFETLIKGGIDTIIKEVEKVKRKAGS
ncbi:putative ArCR [uncultured archaeon]|nr:putative ArCR [uncultured archaeon]